MPFTRVSLRSGKKPEFLKALADTIHEVLVRSFDVPADDRFLVITQHEAHEFYYHATYLRGNRSDDLVIIQVFGGKSRSQETKRSFYRDLAESLAKSPGLRACDVMVLINTNQFEDWSFGDGKAQMLDLIGS